MMVRFVGEGIEDWKAEHYNSKAFMRRVKRFVRAPQHIFEIVVPPQWMELCRTEVSSLGYDVLAEDTSTDYVALKGRIWDAYRLCLWLRTASRVIIRLGQFRASSVKVFQKGIKDIPWELWLNPDIPLRLYCNVEYSSLRHEGMVCEETVKAICRRFNEHGLSISWEPMSIPSENRLDEFSSPRCRLWINLIHDICTVKMDLTGAHLHERGYRLEPGYAPLRETLACAMLKLLKWDPDQQPLIDAMTGSGTLAIEAALIGRNKAPGLERPFLFEHLPFFDDAPWRYEKKAAIASIKELSQPVIAIDKDARQMERARRNAERAGVVDSILWIQGDFFSFVPDNFGVKTSGAIVMNPPYGRRLSISIRGLYARIKDHLEKHYQNWAVGLVLPDANLLNMFQPYSPAVFRLPHGGLWIHFAVFRVSGN
jgi:putative N6-adenine-specific DNA methylase